MDEPCNVPQDKTTAEEIIKWAIGKCVENKAEFEKYLPVGKRDYSAREVINACGDALTAVGIENNLKQ